MKVSKNTVLVCFAGMFVSATIFIICKTISCGLERYENVTVNIFTGFMISLIITLTSYFHEKRKLIINARMFLTSELQFIDFYHIQIGKLLEICACQFDCNKTIDYYSYFNKRCERAEGFLELITESSDKLNSTDYNGFVKNSKLASALNDIYSFGIEINGLRQLSSGIIRLSLEVQILLQDVNIRIMQQQPVDFNYVNAKMEDYNKTMLVKLSKLHEYTASLTLTVEKLLYTLCKNVNCGIKANDVVDFSKNIRDKNRKLSEGE